MRLETLFVIAVVALFGALSVVSVRAEPIDSGSDTPARPDRVSDVDVIDFCRDVADLCSDDGEYCRTNADLCRRVASFCQENPEQCRELVQFCRAHQSFCERLIEYCKSHDVRCRTLLSTCEKHPERCRNLLNCVSHPDRCHDRPTDRPGLRRDRSSDRPVADGSLTSAGDPLYGIGR